MKITPNSVQSQLASSIAASRSAKAAGGSTPTAKNNGKAAAVDLSSAARHLANLENSDGDIDVAKVKELRAAIASGQLKIDTSRIADNIISSARELLK